MTTYTLEEVDDIWTIRKGDEDVGRVVSKRDGEAIIEELQIAGSGVLRDRLLRDVSDAIEEAFDEWPR